MDTIALSALIYTILALSFTLSVNFMQDRLSEKQQKVGLIISMGSIGLLIIMLIIGIIFILLNPGYF